MEPFVVLISGSREFYGMTLMFEKLRALTDAVWAETPERVIVIVAGGAAGADFLAKVWALDHMKGDPRVRYLEFPAEWDRYGKAAGAIRNQAMLKHSQPAHALAFPVLPARGTLDMIARLKDAKVPLEVYEVFIDKDTASLQTRIAKALGKLPRQDDDDSIVL